MLDRLKRFLADITRQDIVSPRIDERLAVAALLVHAVGIDGAVGPAERSRLAESLARHFALGPDEVADLLRDGQAADREAVDLYAFTSVLKRHLEPAGRLAVVELLWEAVLADGTLHEFEDNLVWRTAELLDVRTRDRVLLRKKVESRLGIPAADD
jgi:uncharacterized tellurite resistance protein B-like protein